MRESHEGTRRYEAVYAERERIVTGRMPGNRYEAHAHEMTRARIYVDHETRVPAYSLPRTRLHTRNVCLRIRQHAHVSCGCQRECCVRAA